MKKIIFSIIIITVISTISFFLFQRKSPSSILSPNASKSLPTRQIIGFLPFWQMASIENLRFPILTEIIYFGLRINEKGEIETKDSDGNREQGAARLDSDTFKKLQKKAKESNTKLSLAIILQDNEKVETFLSDKDAWERLVENVSALIDQQNLSGINLDFEYSGIPGKETVAGYTNFVTNFVHELKTHYPASPAGGPSLTVSVDITADAIRKSRLYDVGELAKVADFIILMGYDFYRPSSSVAGPIAPLTGKETYEYDVTSAALDFLKFVPKEKLILGVAYYGWDFPTVDENKGSSVEKRPDESVALSTYKRTRRLMEERNPDIRFDEESQTPWMIYRDPDTNGIRQVWFENEISLAKKYDLVNKENLSGIAIWALGYDGDHDDLWKLLNEKLGR